MKLQLKSHENKNPSLEFISTHCGSFYVEWKFLATVTGIMFQFASQEEMIIFFVDCEFSLFLQTFMQFNRKNLRRTFSSKMFLFNDMHNWVKYLWIQTVGEGHCILQEWSMVKNVSCVSCAAWNVFPINSLLS